MWTQPAADRVDHGFVWVSGLVRDAVHDAIQDDPDPADPYRGLYITDERAGALAGDGVEALPDDRLGAVAERLGLDELDIALLGLVAAPEVSPGYGRLYAYLHDDVTRKLASPGLAVRLLAPAFAAEWILARLAGDARLRRLGALRVVDERNDIPLQDRPLRVADPLAGFLVGADLGSRSLAGRASRLDPSDAPVGRDRAVADLARHLANAGDVSLIVSGPDATTLIAHAAGRGVLTVGSDVLVDGGMRHDAVLLSLLEERVLCLTGLDDVPPEDRAAVVSGLADLPTRIVIVSGTPERTLTPPERPPTVVRVPEPTVAERAAAWRWFSGMDGVAGAAAKYRLSIEQIGRACELAALAADLDDTELTEAHLDAGARRASGGSLDELAGRVRPAYTWDQLVLPERPLSMLRSIFAFLRHRDQVLTDWGYERALAQNQGIKVLFAGDSGTGKTMAAQVLAAELGLEIYRVDLATTVSKYIGETEKNLDRIFAAAEGSNAMLFFDEADALFGRRSDVGDAHDRYANLETAYLLQRMESYPGAVILATNFRHNIDEAFLRRLDVVIDFPFPDERDRERIWRVALPEAAPVADDLDIPFLATRFKLSGGGIRNASLAGAFLAASDGGVIRMEHLVQGVANEYAKLGRLTMESEFERFHGLVTGTADREPA